LLQTTAVVYCAVDSLLPMRGGAHPGFDEFMAALEHSGVPIVWVSSRTRFQLDAPRRELGHGHPFIAEGGCGVYLPEGYFHLPQPKTMRLGRFTCIPVAEPQPAASEALEELSEETAVPVVTLASLKPRELAQNLGLPAREAELARHRDFDEPFFFAGSSSKDIERFVTAARRRKLPLRQNGMLWSLAVGANLKQCVTGLAKLYDRALHSHPTKLGIAGEDEAQELFPACDRTILLSDENRADEPAAPDEEGNLGRAQHSFGSAQDTTDPARQPGPPEGGRYTGAAPLQGKSSGEEGEVGHVAGRAERGLRASRTIPFSAPDLWERVLESITVRR
jgi:mannosyl-3-phosphoglycerate phosphatase